MLNGVVTFVLGWVSRRGLDYAPLNRLAVVAAVTVVAFGALLVLMARLNRAGKAAEETEA